MNLTSTLLAGSIPALLVLVSTSAAFQDMGKPAQGTPADATAKKDDPAHPMPKPTKEHEWLKGRVGTWDCVMSCPAMGAPSKGTETAKMFGDFWLKADVESTYMGQPFKGINLMTYDPIKQKYVSSWCETMTPALMVMEGTTDASGKKLTSKGMCPNMEGKIVEYTSVLEIKGPDETLLTMYETAKGPTDPMAMKIEYKRRK